MVESALLLRERSLLTKQTFKPQPFGSEIKISTFQVVFLLRGLSVSPAEVKVTPCNENDRPDDDAYLQNQTSIPD